MNSTKAIINIKIPGAQSGTTASLQIKWTKSQYMWMTSTKGKPQSYHNSFLWGKLTKKERLHINIENLCLNYGGSSFNYEIIE